MGARAASARAHAVVVAHAAAFVLALLSIGPPVRVLGSNTTLELIAQPYYPHFVRNKKVLAMARQLGQYGESHFINDATTYPFLPDFCDVPNPQWVGDGSCDMTLDYNFQANF